MLIQFTLTDKGRGEVDYLVFKLVHIFGIILFLGNIIVTALWKVQADRTRDPRIIAFAQRLVTLTDWVFTFGWRHAGADRCLLAWLTSTSWIFMATNG